jgi:hypothetical protein
MSAPFDPNQKTISAEMRPNFYLRRYSLRSSQA